MSIWYVVSRLLGNDGNDYNQGKQDQSINSWLYAVYRIIKSWLGQSFYENTPGKFYEDLIDCK